MKITSYGRPRRVFPGGDGFLGRAHCIHTSTDAFQHVRKNLPCCGIVIHHQGRQRASCSGTIFSRAGPKATPTDTVNRNVLPTPGSLSSSISPPISSTNRRPMVRPSPVPPAFVSWRHRPGQGLKQSCRLLGCHADAGILTENRSLTLSPTCSCSSTFR